MTELSELVDTIYRVYHYDFRGYAEASLRRRLASALVHARCRTLSELTERLAKDPALFTEMLRFLTVQVSDMFRDPPYWRAIREHVVPYLETYAALKIWVAGCATGEEAYSLAIVLLEEKLLERSLIYATDINPESLRSAQAGVFEAQRVAKFSENYRAAGGKGSLSDYYHTAYDGALFDAKLRKAIVFSDHSLATDSVFAETQFVSCRNVLIYFDRPLQDRALGVLTDSLGRKGFLGLGMKETLRFTPHHGAFVETVPEARIYRKV
ncbi:MAG TPA: CheR family methyltransferase [Kofleriaceae bacterium]|nr:CheR family methyltransferase [Kofleriaceae bacterium]